MISKKLINQVPEAMTHIKKNVGLQLLALVANICIMWNLGHLLEEVLLGAEVQYVTPCAIIIVAIAVRYFATIVAAKESHEGSQSVKIVLREKIYNKMLKLGTGYTKKISTAEVLQVTGEGVDQLEIYFGNYLPQFFYSMTAPIILFVVVAIYNIKVAAVLFLCVPLIPISIMAVQKFAKKLLAKYWGEYTGLGDDFLENLQGLNTLKIYDVDQQKHVEMNKQAERFRKITMRVLTMQLNSISVMDIIAYGGTTLGIVVTINEFSKGNLEIGAGFMIILLATDFFLPMRLLGSYFHVAMNGMAASKKIFTLLEMEEPEEGTSQIRKSNISAKQLSFAYDENGDKVLKGIDFNIDQTGVYAIVGKSGCGKSTIAALLSGHLRGYEGSLSYGSQDVDGASQDNILNAVTMIGLGSHLFTGSVRDNLRMGNPSATDEMMWTALEEVNLASYLKGQKGLDTQVAEKGSNFSGGQCQRLALSRALLHDTATYIFDEATSNIDVESETEIMKVIYKLGEEKNVVLISHRLANVVGAKEILVMKDGDIVENGSHGNLLEKKAYYKEMWDAQQNLENVDSSTREGADYEK